MLELDALPSLDDQQKAALRKAGLITPAEVLLISPFDLGKRLRIKDIDHVQAIIRGVSQDIAPWTRTIAESLEEDRDRWVSCGDGDIDGMLGGGVRRGCITEIAGERWVREERLDRSDADEDVSSSASGKSHLGLQLAVNCQLSPYSPLPGGAILLTSERKVSFTRLEELARHSLLYARSLLSSPSTSLPDNAKSMLDNIQTMHVTEVDGLEHALAYAVPAIIAQIAARAKAQEATGNQRRGSRALPVRLIVIDSIGALFRASFDSNMSGLSQRSKMLCIIADKLKALAEEQDLAVVVINQVSDVFGRGGLIGEAKMGSESSRPSSPGPTTLDEPTMTYKVQSRYFSGQTDRLAKEASLGLVWANAVNVRIMLSRTGRRRALDHSDLSNKRTKISAYDQEVQAEKRQERRTTAPRTGDAVRPLSQGDGAWESTLVRRMHLVFSPSATEATLDYVILDSGIHSLTASRVSAKLPGWKTSVQLDNDGADDAAGGVDEFSDLPPDWWEEGELSSRETPPED